MTAFPLPRASLMRRWFGPLGAGRTWRATAHLLLDLPVGVCLFAVVVTGLTAGGSLLVTLIGVPLVCGTILFGRLTGTVERRRAALLLDSELHAPLPLVRDGSLWEQTKRIATDGPGWKGVVYGLVMLPWGVVTFTLALVTWTVAAAMATAPLWVWLPPDDDGSPFNIGRYEITGGTRFGYVGAVCVVGVVLLALAPRIIAGLATADRALIRALLSRPPETVLAERVEQLTASRAASVEGAASELRRIERDLHDGAQQRLVALAMDLGLAKERLSGSDDPEAAALVTRAHDEAKQAIAELRDLVRGIHPQILADRGLDAALSALVARSNVPINVDVDIAVRPPAPIEAAAYFVVAEALANLAKHSGATRGSVRVEQIGARLLIDVRDDGRGGATESLGGGLAGLHDRVAAVDGMFRLTSPAGGPTEVHVELPCGS